MANAKKRVGYIDVAKGLGMLTVIFGHILSHGGISVYFNSFYMPLFFFLAGMCYRKEKYPSLGLFVKARAKTLLLPYFLFSVATWGVWALYNLILQNEVESYLSPLLQTFIAQGSAGYLVHNAPLWFVSCLFVVEILYYFIAKLPKGLTLLICLAFASVARVISRRIYVFDFSTLPFSIDVAITQILFYGAGNLFARFLLQKTANELSLKKKAIAWALTLPGLAVGYSLSLMNPGVTASGNVLGKSPSLFYPIAFFNLAFFLLLAFLIDKSALPRLKRGLTYIGRNSFYYMAIHVPLKGFLMAILSKLFHTTPGEMSHDYLYSLLTFLITLIVATPTVMAINAFIEFCKQRRTKRGSAA